MRSLFSRREAWSPAAPARTPAAWAAAQPGHPAAPPPTGRGPLGAPGHGGRTTGPALATDELAEHVAGQLLARWGVVFWDLAAHEDLAVPWREILWALRRFEARGLVRGGRFVTGFAGEQYALPEALDELRHVRRTERKGELVRLSAADPLNLSGVILPGKRVPALRTNSVLFPRRADRTRRRRQRRRRHATAQDVTAVQAETSPDG